MTLTVVLEALIVAAIVALIFVLFLPWASPVVLWKGRPLDHWALDLTVADSAAARRRAADELTAAVRDPAVRTRRKAAAVLGEAVRRIQDGALGTEELPRLLDAVANALATDADAEVRAMAAEVLGQARAAPPAALAALQQAQRDASLNVRAKAAAALDNQRKRGAVAPGR
jgi:hypothetical protein